MESRIIVVDFDGTVVTQDYPDIGRDIGALSILKELVEKGHQLILFTMRYGILLEEASAWFKERGIPLLGINKNPSQHTWTKSPKVFGHLYIDDTALGCPTTHSYTAVVEGKPVEVYHRKPFVNWDAVRQLLVEKGVL